MYKSIILLFALAVFASCNTTKYLSEDVALMKGNKLKVSSPSKSELDFQIKEQLIGLYKQKPNSNFLLLFPREWFFFKADRMKNKDSWFTKSLVKVSEAPSILDTNLCNETKSNMEDLLFNVGYFNAKASYTIQVKNKKATVSYFIQTGNRYFLNDIKIFAEDKTIDSLVNADLASSLLQPGNPLDYNVFQKERARISELLFNHGYIDFNPLYIEPILADTIHGKANISIRIRNPRDKTSHSKFFINKIIVNPRYSPTEPDTGQLYPFDSLSILQVSDKEFIKPWVLREKILINPGEVANKSLADATYDQLYKLGTYRFISIESKLDSLEPEKVNYLIQLSPSKKWVLDFGADLNYTSLRKTSPTLLGLSGYVHLKNRNMFKRAVAFTTKLEAGTELNFNNLSNFNSLNIHFGNEFSLPSFKDITNSFSIYKFISKPFLEHYEQPDSRTVLRAGIDYENLVSLYKYISINANIEYDWYIKRRKRFTLRTLGFFLYLPNTTNAFEKFLQGNKFLIKSFTDRRLFTSYFLDNLTFYYQSKIKRNTQHAVITSFNMSGLEVHALNSAYNLLTNKKDTFSFINYEFSKFYKGELDYRFYYIPSSRSKFAFRFAVGLVKPFGTSSSIPYIKQFYVGGPQSIRAWNIREIGPGGLNLADSSINQTFFAAGDFKLEASLEYRFDIYWRFKGALFLDAGNIWLLPNNNTDDPSGRLGKNFLKEIAVGTGLGLRLDLTYFLFRVDYGFKLRNNYPDKDGKYWLYGPGKENGAISVNQLFKNSTLHLALDYPF